jgi:hypothetical protein
VSSWRCWRIKPDRSAASAVRSTLDSRLRGNDDRPIRLREHCTACVSCLSVAQPQTSEVCRVHHPFLSREACPIQSPLKAPARRIVKTSEVCRVRHRPIRSTLDSRFRGNDDCAIRLSVAYLLPSLKTSEVCRVRRPFRSTHEVSFAFTLPSSVHNH